MFDLPTRPLPIIMVLKSSLKLYRIIFLRTLFFSALYGFLLLIPNFVLHWQGVIVESLHHSTVNVIIGFVELWVVSVLIHAGYQSMVSSNKSIGNSCFVATKKYGISLITSILYAIMSMIGFLVLLLPGIFVQVLFVFYLLLILVKNDGIISSLKHSAKLVWGCWWRVFFTILIPLIVLVIVAGILEKLFHFPVAFLYRRMLQEVNWRTYVVLWVLLTIFIPWVISVGLCLYQDLKGSMLI